MIINEKNAETIRNDLQSVVTELHSSEQTKKILDEISKQLDIIQKDDLTIPCFCVIILKIFLTLERKTLMLLNWKAK